jgi:hypothetical protein
MNMGEYKKIRANIKATIVLQKDAMDAMDRPSHY